MFSFGMRINQCVHIILMSYVIMQLLGTKERGIVLLSIPRTKALAIAYLSRTDNVRAHADMKLHP